MENLVEMERRVSAQAQRDLEQARREKEASENARTEDLKVFFCIVFNLKKLNTISVLEFGYLETRQS